MFIQKIIENENIQKIRKWIYSNNDILDKESYMEKMEDVTDHINFYRSMQTKINYLSKLNYPTNKVKTKKKYNITDEQKEIIEKLQLDIIVKDIYNIKFNTIRMHTKETIMEGIALITTFEENISRLIVSKKHINLFLLSFIKEKLKAAINTGKVIPKNTKDRCIIEIDKIASDMKRDTETSSTKIQVMLDKTNNCNGFCDNFIGGISRIVIDPVHNNFLKGLTQTIKSQNENYHINALYGTLITSLNQIIDMKQKLAIKSKENEKIRQYMVDDFFAKDESADTLKEQADIQIKKNTDCCQDFIYSILDEIIETKGLVVKTEALVFEILKEIKN
ncbi:hypothetical protein BDAP_000166 [Binucleata daphniae]